MYAECINQQTTDYAGNASIAGAGCIEVVTEALCAEAHACIARLRAAFDWGMQHVILETDSQVLVKALNTEEYDRAPGECSSEKRNFLCLPALLRLLWFMPLVYVIQLLMSWPT